MVLLRNRHAVRTGASAVGEATPASEPDTALAKSRSTYLRGATADKSLSLPEYILSLIVLFGGWMVALFGIAGQVRPAGVMAFAITASAGLGFVVFSWFIYGSNIQTLMWVADLMEDRVLRTRENWKNETLRSLVEVGSWLHITFRIYIISESALVSAFCGAVVGAFCVVLGDYFTDYTRAAEQGILAPAETGLVGYRFLRRLSGDGSAALGLSPVGWQARERRESQHSCHSLGLGEEEQQAEQGSQPSAPENDEGTQGPSLAGSIEPDFEPPAAAPSEPIVEFASVVYTPQFVSLATSFVLAASLYHFKDSQDLGLALILTTLTNVAFITAEQLLMLWRPTRWAAVILHDRVMNVVYNWQSETIRSGFETCFYLSSLFSCYALTENVTFAVLVGTLAGMSIVLTSAWIGIGEHAPGSSALEALSGNDLERGIFMLAIFGWACATLLYTIFVYSRSSVLALGLVLPTGIAIVCLAEMAVGSHKRNLALHTDDPSIAPLPPCASDARSVGSAGALASPRAPRDHAIEAAQEADRRQGMHSEGALPTAPLATANQAPLAVPLKSKWLVFQHAVGSVLFPASSALTSADRPQHRSLPAVELDDVLDAREHPPRELQAVKARLAKQADRLLTREEIKGKQYIVVEGFVFDVADFAKGHPGGEGLLLDYAKRQADVSDQFAAFHHPVVYKRLLPLLVGKLQEQTPSQASDAVADAQAEAAARPSPLRASAEYRRLRDFLWARGYFDGAESDFESARSCANQHLVVLSLAVLAVCQVALLSHNLAHTPTQDQEGLAFAIRSIFQCVLAAVTMGFFWQQVAFIAHDALHNGVVQRTKEARPKSPFVPHNVLGWFHGSVCFGISSAMWLDEHSVHHAMTMRPCQDAQFNYLPLWCVSLKEFATRFWQDMRDSAFFMPLLTRLLVSVQHRTLLPLAVLIGRFNFYILNVAYAVRNRVYYDLAGMCMYWAMYVTLVAQLSASPALQWCFVLVSHWTVGVLHVQLLINHLATDAFTALEEDELEFFSFQIRTTRNIDSTENTDWFHGGLQYQIEHHLFPQLPRHRLALAKPAVQEICRRNGLVYESVGFFEATRLSLADFESIANEVWAGNLAA